MIKILVHRVLLATLAAKTLLATGLPGEEVIRVAKLGNSTLEVARLEQPVLIEGMKALFADLSAAGLGAAADWFKDGGPVDLQNLRVDRSYGQPQSAEGDFLAAMRGDAPVVPSGTGISKPDLWESAAIKATLGVDESKMTTTAKPKPMSGGGKPGKPGKPGGGKPPVDPHNPPGPGDEIPEPSTWALLLGGGVMLAGRHRRR